MADNGVGPAPVDPTRVEPAPVEPTRKGMPSAEEITLRKKRRTLLRRQITNACKQILTVVNDHGSRGALKGVMAHLKHIHHEIGIIHTDLLTIETDDQEVDTQEETHFNYMKAVGEAYEKAEAYLLSRRDEADSVAPINIPDEGARRRAEELEAAQKRADETRAEAEEAERLLKALTLQDDDHHSSVSHQRPVPPPIPGGRPRDPLQKTGHTMPPGVTTPPLLDTFSAPDEWIDHYCHGALPPVVSSRSSRSSVSVDLEVYQGRTLDWFGWIDIFKALVHDTPKSPAEKLAVLKRYIRGDSLDAIHGLGGGEDAYKEALVRLKQSCGRRDVMRSAHIQAINQLDFKQDPTSFKRYAERIRTHFFDLTRIGETSAADLIEKVCLRLSLHDRLAWNEGKWGQLEHRSLNDFGSWLCHRATAYQNAHSIAADQSTSFPKRNADARGDARRNARTHQGTSSAGFKSSGKPFCFKCEKEHRLVECNEFKELSIGERVTFCVRHRLCFFCFSTKHVLGECPIKKPCKHEDCRYTHHELLHDSGQLPVRKVKPSSARSGRQKVNLGMIRLEIRSGDGRSSSMVNILVDEGSDSTLMTSSFAKKMSLRGKAQILQVDGVGGEITHHKSKRVQFTLITDSEDHFEMEASTMKKVANPAPVVNWKKKKLHWPHISDLPVGEVGGNIDLLLGLDYAHLLVVSESRGGEAGQPIASHTKFGWIIRGVTGPETVQNPVRSFRAVSTVLLEDIKVELRRFCDTEEFGTEFQSGCLSPDNKRALDLATKNTRKLDVGYQVPITWRVGEPDLINNQEMASNRWRSLLRRFDKDPDFERDYRAAMAKTFDQGYASVLQDPSDAKYFLAHHGVYKGPKLRVVFDAAATFRGKCLNDSIIAGPALQPSLAAVITRFRAHEIAWASDVEAMFSRFRLSEEDANYFCFLWGKSTSPDVCRMDRLPFGASCSPFVAIYALRRIMEDAGANDPVISAVRESMYVDDYLNSASSVDTAVAEASFVRDCLLNADLKLQRWISNSPEFIRKLTGGDGPSPMPPAHSLSPDPEEKVLGIMWSTNTDTLGFKVVHRPTFDFTRVELISRVASVFDPLGTASPLIVKAKIRLRELGTKGVNWTDTIEGDDHRWWQGWFKALQLLTKIEVPRCLFPDGPSIISSELHIFCDASEEAYAAVIYIRNVYSHKRDPEVVVRQVKAANKIAPKKSISVPKLELNAALLGARVARTIKDSIPVEISRRRFWTDSSTVRNWIRATAAYYQVFVSNRIGEIQSLTDAEEWRFVPGMLNPADAATRSTLEGDIFPPAWLAGPDFLLQAESEWPVDLPWMAINEEMRAARSFTATQIVTTDWSKVHLSQEDIPALCRLKDDFLDLIKKCQAESFGEDLRRLQNKKSLYSTSSILALAPILNEDGLLRLGGRAGRAKLPYDQLHPPLLSGQHPLAEKIVKAFHENLKHVGTDFLLSYIRQHFWITRGRELVKKVRRDCVVCRRNRAQPCEQMMADLTESRLDFGTLPFTRTAVDLFGPLEIGLYRNRTAKRWGVLYTCLVTRAIFLDLVPSLSSMDFLLSLRRFIAMFRSPEVLHSDNGTNFVGAERELREAADLLYASEEIPKFMHAASIQWTFQPPRTPHFGGAHESLVKSTKRALYNALEQEKGNFRHPTEDLLRTLLFEVAGLLNTRPLTYASSDPADFRPLTPNDFLNRAPTAHPPAGVFNDAPPRDQYKYLQRTLNLFWDLWKTVYLQSLASRKKWKIPRPNLAVGDIVLEINKGFGRGIWSIGHVVRIFPGPDGCVRAVDVQLPAGIFRRGITELCLLETGSSVPSSGEDVSAKSA